MEYLEEDEKEELLNILKMFGWDNGQFQSDD